MTSPPVSNPIVIVAPAPVAYTKIVKYNKKVLIGLGIAEVVIGSLAIVFSCVLLGYVNDSYRNRYILGYSYHYRYSSGYSNYFRGIQIGEGIWCGVWVLVAGALGIASGRKRPTACLINSHMGFSIVGALFSAGLLTAGIIIAILNPAPMVIALESLMAIGGLTTLILCIVSAVYCCKLTSSAGMEGCCGSCCTEEHATQLGDGQVSYVSSQQNDQQLQQSVIQAHPPMMSGQPGTYPGNYVTVMQHGIAASHQPVLTAQQPAFMGQQQVLVAQQPAFVAQQPALVAQQPVHASQSHAPVAQQQQSSSTLEHPQRSENELKQQKDMASSTNAAFTAEDGDTLPPYSKEH